MAPIAIEADETPPTVLAQAIVRISEEMLALRRGGLNRRAVVILVANKSKLSSKTVGLVLDSLESLKKDYCT